MYIVQYVCVGGGGGQANLKECLVMKGILQCLFQDGQGEVEPNMVSNYGHNQGLLQGKERGGAGEGRGKGWEEWGKEEGMGWRNRMGTGTAVGSVGVVKLSSSPHATYMNRAALFQFG